MNVETNSGIHFLAAVTCHRSRHATKLTRFLLFSEHSCYNDGLRSKRLGFDPDKGNR
jgi:hypothetical protein